MRLIIAAIGRLKSGPERELAARYRERGAALGRNLGFQSLDIVEIAESRARRPEDRVREEASALASVLPENAAIVVLDARGEALSSMDLARRLEGWRNDGTPAVTFLIGSADGLAEPWRKQAELNLCFGAATWPHQLLRVMLLEQIYRAMAILAGHPYHRA